MVTFAEVSVPVDWVTIQEEGKSPEVARVFDIARDDKVIRFAEINNHSKDDVSGWRVYFSILPKTDAQADIDEQKAVTAMLGTKNWFALAMQSQESVAVYFPSELNEQDRKNEFLFSLDTYCRAENAVVMVPAGQRIRSNDVAHPWSGGKEQFISLIMGNPGTMKLNGFRLNGYVRTDLEEYDSSGTF